LRTVAAFVLFEAAGARLALDASDVLQVLRMASVAPVPGAPPHVRGVLNLHGVLVPVVDVRARLGAPPSPPDPSAQLVLARTGGRLVALEVDRVVDVVEVDRSRFEPPSRWGAGAALASGALALPDGAVVVQSLDAWLAGADLAAEPAAGAA
jgi:purine-binding chemotaxis protein CheW